MFERLITTQEGRIKKRVDKCIDMWNNGEDVTDDLLNKWLKETGLSKEEFENIVMRKYLPVIKEAEIYVCAMRPTEKYSKALGSMKVGDKVLVTMQSGRKAEYVCCKRKQAWGVDWHWIYLKFESFVN